MNVLLVNSSARAEASTSRQIVAKVGEQFAASGAQLVSRDLAHSLPHVNEAWVQSGFTDPNDWTDAMRDAAGVSSQIVDEVMAADVLVLGVPIYNFGVPAAFKAWVDQVCRAGRTFRYTENGPEGLLKGKRAIVVVSSGGVPIDSPVDFATPHVRQVLNFIGITDIQVIGADGQMTGEGKVEAALEQAAAVA
ncbi:FMN-dependent NADH-azoreductase [Litorivicinus lipolyticus]|uniref:FMN-dependent NADH-azoreductase n=1 Tax=Litorivicinus lipolyticus TaxID=418701 RepID=UPI001B8832DD|nr:NAD(P)H-dependent oxidoreductase [Litorivicinus lipolyticus]